MEFSEAGERFESSCVKTKIITIEYALRDMLNNLHVAIFCKIKKFTEKNITFPGVNLLGQIIRNIFKNIT